MLVWVSAALRENLSREQLLCKWKGDEHVLGSFDGIRRDLAKFEWLKEQARQKYGAGHGNTEFP